MELKFGNQTVGENHPVYFIADIAANHDGDLNRAKMLIHLAKESGADAAKFQNFKAPKAQGLPTLGFVFPSFQQIRSALARALQRLFLAPFLDRGVIA